MHLHGLSIIHRDLKPANVLLKTTGESRNLLDMVIKLGDFNISKFSPEEDRTSTQLSFRTFAHFCAPELLVRRGDRRTQCYLGVRSFGIQSLDKGGVCIR